MATTFLLHRPQDLVVLGVRWSGPDPVGGELVAPDDGARLTLVFPPQHIAEQVDMTESIPRKVRGVEVWGAQLAAPSTVTFTVAAGTRIPLTVEGVLAATAAAAPQRDGTVLEIPWRLHVAPDAAAWRHSARPVVSPDGVTGLWRTRAAEPTAPAALNVVVDHAAQTDDPFDLALSRADRLTLMENGAETPALARRLELTTLGGTLSATGRWPHFSWDQEVALGRDILVRTITEVRLFPFGHRGELESLTRRVFDHGTGTAALRKEITLHFVDPVVTTSGDDVTFPFDTVQVLQPTYVGLPEQQWETRPRGTAYLDQLKNELAALEGERDHHWGPEVRAEGERVREQWEIGGWEAERLTQLETAMAPTITMINDGLAAQIEMQWEFAEIARLMQEQEDIMRSPVGPDGYLSEDDQRRLAEIGIELTNLNAAVAHVPSAQRIEALRQQIAPLEREAQPLREAVWAERNRFRAPEELAQAQFPQAVEWVRVNALALALKPEIAALEAELQHPYSWYTLVHDAKGVLRIPVRMTGPEGDVEVSIPMIAVRVFRWEPPHVLTTFDSVTDPETIARVSAMWNDHAAGEVDLVPTRVDLVRDARRARRAGRGLDVDVSPSAGDVRVVHAMSIAGHLVDGEYRAALDSFTIALPELDTLLPKPPDAPRWATKAYAYSREFLDDPAADLLFETVGDPLDISFLDDSRNAGALLSPRIAADALSRKLGPVAASALRDAVTDAAGLTTLDPTQLFAEGATLLGFDLRDILGAIDLDAAPAIVHDIVDGKPPTVSMTWPEIPVVTEESFVSTDTTLTLKVTIGPRGAEVSCTLSAFELALPTPDTAILRLRVSGLNCTMIAGEAPNLTIGALSAEFTGALRLIEKLGNAVGLGGGGPRVKAGREGIAVGYELAIPAITTTGFQLRDITFRAGVDVPFGPTSPSVSIAFASREKPFLATVLMFGGGGYFDLVIDKTGIRRLEASIEFGASVAVDFFVAEAEVHVLGAFRYTQAGAAIVLAGYLRMGGSVKILGLVTVSVELVLALSYESAGNRLVGRATLVLEIDLTLYSTSVELDTGPWAISGDDDGAAPEALDAAGRRPVHEQVDADLFVEQWRLYRSAFA